MTSQQMLRKLDSKVESCEVIATSDVISGVWDFAASAGFTPYACIQRNTCPVCGSKGTKEHYDATATSDPSDFFWCDKSRSHVFEYDSTRATADRVNI